MNNIRIALLAVLSLLLGDLMAETVVFDNWNKAAVSDWPNRPTTFSLQQPTTIHYLDTYHWHGGRGSTGSAVGASIKLLETTSNRIFGPWQAELRSGTGGAPNVHWVARPNVTLPPGNFVVLDSDPATWSYNGGSSSAGFSRITSGEAQPPRQPVASGSNPFRYLGCFKDTTPNRVLDGYTFRTDDMTAELCIATCSDKGFQYAGTQYGSHCFCGNIHDRAGKASNCDMACSGNSAQKCGGGWANSVYQTGGSQPQRTTQPTYIGCFKDTTPNRVLDGYTFQSGSMTAELCTATCTEKGFSYAATQYGAHCFCGNQHDRAGTASNCDMACSGDSSQKCGGGWANSVYRLR